jgi:soluble lytic murein transglycosylase
MSALATFPLLVTLLTADPRPSLVALELANRNREALARAQQEAADRPAAARQIGLDYLRGHLLDLLGRPGDAGEAFAAAINATPRLAFYSRYRLAVDQEQLGHPEVAAGLIATAASAEPASPLLPEAIRLLSRTLGRGGDCRLLRAQRPRQLPAPERPQVLLDQADCDLKGTPSLAVPGAPARELAHPVRPPSGLPGARAEPAAPGGEAAHPIRPLAGSPGRDPADPLRPPAESHHREAARNLLTALLEENHSDDVARAAAERLAALVPDGEHGHVPLLLGLAFFAHRELERAARLLAQVPGPPGKPRTASAREAADARYLLGRVRFAQELYEPAGADFAALAESAAGSAERARARLQQGRCYEMQGQWQRATATFRLAFLAEPEGETAPAALLSTLRLEWRSGNEETASSLFAMLGGRSAWREAFRRAALFLAASDLVRGRGDRAGSWLDRAAGGSREGERTEVAYWRGRLAELRQDAAAAVAAYLPLLREDPYHPLAQSARARLGAEPLAAAAQAVGRKLAASRRPADLAGAWLLLGAADPAGKAAERKLRQLLLANRGTAPFMSLEEASVEAWPLWSEPLRRPEEMLLALGAWHEGAPAVRDHFPPGSPSLALTGCRLLARTGETSRAIQLAEALRERVPEGLPLALLPPAFDQCLYPLAYREALLAEGRLRGVDPLLLAALIRVESRFDRLAISPSAARGLTQFAFPAARQVASRIGMERLDPDDLFKPEVAIDLGGAYLAELLRAFHGARHAALAAYDAGEAQAAQWRSWCFSQEPEEYFTKVSSKETRGFLEKVLAGWAHYRRLYS